MKTRAALAIVVLAALALGGCTLTRELTTRSIGFTENLIPSRNKGSSYTNLSDTGGPIGPLPFDIQITGDIRNKYDKYNGGVDWAFLTYRVTNSASAPVRIRLWATLATSLDECPFDNETSPLILDVTIQPNQTVTFDKTQGQNIEELRRITEALLRSPLNAAACVYVQAECSDPTGRITLHQLDIVGQAHGSLV